MGRGSGAGLRVHRLAQSVGKSLAKGRPPGQSLGLDDYLDECPGDVLGTLDGFAGHLAAGNASDPTSLGYLFLMEGQLERLRYRADAGFTDAAGLIAAFQREAGKLASAGRIDGAALSMIGAVLHEAKIAASEELIASIEQHSEAMPIGEAMPDLAAVLDEMAGQCDGDPFSLASLLAETGHAMPREIRAMMPAVLAASAHAPVRETAVLHLLDPEPCVRKAAIEALQADVSRLTPDSLRRLIAIRNWLPEPERSGLDVLIRAARAKGIVCASWREAEIEIILAAAIDGSGAQGFLIVTKAGRKKRLSSILLRAGILEAWSGPPENKTKIEDAIDNAGFQVAMTPVSRAYLDETVCAHLAKGLAAGLVAPAGLLQAAETIGAAIWRPEPREWQDTLAGLLANIPQEMRAPEALRSILARSGDWAYEEGLPASWFESGPDAARITAKIRREERGTGLERVIAEVIAPRRAKWAELFTRTAQWLRAAQDEGAGLPWREFALLADAIGESRDLAQIPLMRDIAERTAAMNSATL